MAFYQDSWRGGGTGTGAYNLKPRSTSEAPLTLTLLTGQIANGLEIKNAAGTTIFSVSPAGNVNYTGSETVTQALTVTGVTTLQSTLAVTGASTLSGGIIVSNGANITGASTFTGNVTLSGLLGFSGDNDLTAGNYQIGRDINGHLQYNVPLVKQHIFTIEGTNKVTISSTTFAVNDNSVFGGTMTVNGALNVSGTATLGGGLSLDQLITWTAGEAIVATKYQMGRDADATNQLHFNIPTGAAIEFSVNDVRRITFDTNGRLGVGIAAADTQIHVSGAHIANRGLIYADSSDHAYIGLNGVAGSQQGFFFMKAGTVEWLQGIPANTTGDRMYFSEGSDLETNVRLSLVAGGNIGFGIAAPTAFAHFVQVVQTSGSPTALLVVGGAHTTLTASTESIGANFNFSATKQFATGALATQREVVIQAPTYGFVGASTISSASTLDITGAPIAGTNATITNSYGLTVGKDTDTQVILGRLLSYNTATDWMTISHLDQTGGNYALGQSNAGVTILNAAAGQTLGLAIGGSSEITLNTSAFYPAGNDGNALGTTGNMWSDLFLADGGVINWNNGNYTVTHAASALTLAPAAASSGVPTALTLTGAAHTSMTASTEDIGVNFNLSATKQWATGALATQREFVIQAPTYGFVAASTITTAASLAITGAPIAGTNATITTPLALWVQAGVGRFDGGLVANSNIDTDDGGTLTIGGANQTGLQLGRSGQTLTMAASTVFNGNLTIATAGNGITYLRRTEFTPVVATSGSVSPFIFTMSANTGQTLSTEAISVNFNNSATVQFATGALATQRSFLIQAPTYGFVGASTLTDAVTFEVTGAPVAGTNATITRSWAARLLGSVKLGGGQEVNRTTSAAGAYTVLLTDYIVAKTGITGGGDTVTLPAAATAEAGRVYIIKDESGTAATNNITVDGNGAETIDGAATQTISSNYGSLTIYSNGSNWFIY